MSGKNKAFRSPRFFVKLDVSISKFNGTKRSEVMYSNW